MSEKNSVPCFESIPFCEAAWWLAVRLLWLRRPRLAKGDHFPMCLLKTPRVSLRFISYYGNWKMETLVTISLVLFLQYFTKTAGFLEDICPCANETHCARPASRNKSIGSLQVRRYIPFLGSSNRCKSLWCKPLLKVSQVGYYVKVTRICVFPAITQHGFCKVLSLWCLTPTMFFVQGNSVFFMSKNITRRTAAVLIDREILRVLRLMASK